VLFLPPADCPQFDVCQAAERLIVLIVIGRSLTRCTLRIAAKSGEDAVAKFDRVHDSVLSVDARQEGGSRFRQRISVASPLQTRSGRETGHGPLMRDGDACRALKD
jgi:hypothetical protein